MKLKENTAFFTVLGSVIFILYILFAVFPIHKEIQFIPEWTVKLTEKSASEKGSSADQNIIPFRLGNLVGYITSEGVPAFVSVFTHKASVSTYAWTSFTDSSAVVTIFSPSGAVLSTIKAAGFPFIDDDRVYMFGHNGNTITNYTLSGEKQWTYEYYAPITCFSSSSSAAAAGYADGSVSYFTPDGKKRFSFFPGGSSRQILYGTAVSPSGSFVASVSGLDEQRFTLVKVTDTQHKIVFHQYLEGSIQEPLFVSFNESEDKVYFHCKTGIGIVDCRSLSSVIIPLSGKIIDVKEIRSKEMLFVLCSDNDMYSVYVLDNDGKLLGSFSFKAFDACIAVDDESLYVGRDSSISKIKLVKE